MARRIGLAVNSRKAARHATSDWQEPDRIVNLLDRPGPADFAEDTYRVLTAVNSALMVIDCAKSVLDERAVPGMPP